MPRDDDFLDPPITPFGKCHTCKETVVFGIKHCPQCGIELDYDEIFPSIHDYFVITQAVSSANNLRTFDVSILLLIGVSFIRFSFDYGLWFLIITGIVWILPLIRINQWFGRHGKWECSDPDYLEAIERMKWSRKLWIAANIFNAITIVAVHTNGAFIKLE